jgi:hypothetical protein
MTALLAAALLAYAAPQAGAPAETDLRCYRLMAELARAQDPAARTLGLTAAQYFLGRIDAAAPGTDLSRIAPVSESERAPLMRRCGDALNEGGFDLRALGASLDRAAPSI